MQKIFNEIHKKKIEILLLTVALIFVFILIYSPHFYNPLPFHFDEWTHISRAVMISEQGFGYFSSDHLVEVGFDVILLFLSFFVNIIKVYQFLPALNAVIISLVLFYFLKKNFNYWVGLSAIMFFAFLKNNANILGTWFYVPFMAAIVFDYLTLFFLEESIKKDDPKKIYLVAFFLALVAFIHQSSFLVLSFVVVIYLCFKHGFIWKHKIFLAPFLILIIPASVIFYSFSHGLSDISAFFRAFIWTQAITYIEFNPLLLYGIFSSICAIIGYIICFKQKKFLSLRIYTIIPLVSVFIYPYTPVIFSSVHHYTFLSAYQRYVYYFMIAAVPLSAVGFYYSFRYTYSFVRKNNKILANVAAAFLIACAIIILSHGYYRSDPQAMLYHSISFDEYTALKSLKDYPKGNVLTLIRLGATVKAISDQNTVFDFTNADKESLLNKFYEGNCTVKKEFLSDTYFKDYHIDYVYSKSKADCSFFDEIYSSENDFIYKVNLR